MRHQSYVLSCSKMTSFLPSEGAFSEKLGIFSKVKNFQNPSCYILEKMINILFLDIMMNQRFMGHQRYVLLCSKMTSFPPSEGVSKITFGSICSRFPCLVSLINVLVRISVLVRNIVHVYWWKMHVGGKISKSIRL